MEYGLTPRIFEYVDNRVGSVQKLNPSKETSALAHDNLLNESLEDSRKDISDVKSTRLSSDSTLKKDNEVAITNINFGFNSETGDFFVRATKGNSEIQFPTYEMMKLKAYFQEQRRNEIEKVG